MSPQSALLSKCQVLACRDGICPATSGLLETTHIRSELSCVPSAAAACQEILALASGPTPIAQAGGEMNVQGEAQ